MKNVFFLFTCLIFVRCNIINPDEKIPAFIRIEKMLVDGSPQFSTNSNNISDAWVFINGNMLGAFELPAEIPILEEGMTSFRIVPGIYKDGIKSHRHFYSYYTNLDTSLVLESETGYALIPQIKYNGNFEIVFNEDFEGLDLEFEASSDCDTVLLQNNDEPIDGLKSGIIYAPYDSATLKIVSKEKFKVEYRPQIPTYLEIDYKSSVDFKVGVIYKNIPSAQLNLRANAERKKIYVDLSDEIGVFNTSIEFQVFFEAIDPAKGDFIALDNIRLLKPKE